MFVRCNKCYNEDVLKANIDANGRKMLAYRTHCIYCDEGGVRVSVTRREHPLVG